MTCITVIEKDLAVNVQAEALGNHVNIKIWGIPRGYLYGEMYQFCHEKIATDYVHEFTKRQARDIVKRYLRYKK